jgi:hypothetical protein
MNTHDLILAIEAYIDNNLDSKEHLSKDNATIIFCLESVLQTAIDSLAILDKLENKGKI